MSDPRKEFKCVKCGFVMNDKDRNNGYETQCPQCDLKITKKVFECDLPFLKKNGRILTGDELVFGHHEFVINDNCTEAELVQQKGEVIKLADAIYR